MTDPGVSPSAQAAIDRGDLDLKACLGFLMQHAFNVIVDDMAKVLEPFGLRKLTFWALKTVVQYPGISQSQLAQTLSMERSNIVSLLDELEAAGLLTRNRVPTNRRAHALRPTAKGITVSQTASASNSAHEARLFATITPQDLAATRRAMLAISRL